MNSSLFRRDTQSAAQLKVHRLIINGRVVPVEFMQSKIKLNRATFAIQSWCN